MLARLLALVLLGSLGAPCAAALAAAPAPTLPAQTPGSLAILLGLDRVRQELGLTSLQRAVLNDIRSDYRDAARTIVAKAAADPAQKASAQRQLEALTARSNRRALAALNPGQVAALKKIERKFLGAYALLDPEIQQQIALTPKQKQKLAAVWAHYQRKISAVNRAYEQGKISHNARIRELSDLRYDQSDDMLERLTKGQYAQFEALIGRPLE